MGVTDVHRVPRTYTDSGTSTPSLSECGVDGCGMQLHVTHRMRDHLCLQLFVTGLRGGHKWEVVVESLGAWSSSSC